MRALFVIVTFVATILATFGTAVPAQGATPGKLAIIVGPVGQELTPVYISLAEAAAVAAETRGASVARAYAPDASVERVLAAVENANIVVYLGHGVGTPNPYAASPSPTRAGIDGAEAWLHLSPAAPAGDRPVS